MWQKAPPVGLELPFKTSRNALFSTVDGAQMVHSATDNELICLVELFSQLPTERQAAVLDFVQWQLDQSQLD